MLRPRFILLSVVSVSCVSAVAAQSAAAPAQTIQVYSFGYTPTPIQLAAGREVTLSFVNQSGSGHDFTAPDFFAGARIVSGAAPNGEVELKPRETKTVTLIPQAGTYQAHCSHFMHATMGMHTQIVVR